MNKLAVLEGILFVVGDEGITLEKICEVLEIDEKEARKLLNDLQKEYEKDPFILGMRGSDRIAGFVRRPRRQGQDG